MNNTRHTTHDAPAALHPSLKRPFTTTATPFQWKITPLIFCSPPTMSTYVHLSIYTTQPPLLRGFFFLTRNHSSPHSILPPAELFPPSCAYRPWRLTLKNSRGPITLVLQGSHTIRTFRRRPLSPGFLSARFSMVRTRNPRLYASLTVLALFFRLFLGVFIVLFFQCMTALFNPAYRRRKAPGETPCPTLRICSLCNRAHYDEPQRSIHFLHR